MKKLSLLVLTCMLLSVVLVACAEAETPHTHAYGEDWAFNAENHYHVCECGEKSDSAAHADTNNDGKCDTCEIIISNDHVFSPDWEKDATHHWHASLCGHDVVDGKAEHTANQLGYCTECGYQLSTPDVASIVKALAISAIGQSAVKNGFIEEITSYELYNDRYAYYWYEYAENYLHVFNEADRANYYNTVDANGEVFSVRIKEGEAEYRDPDATIEYMNGPAIPVVFLSDYPTFYGATDLIEGLYKLGEDAHTFEETVEDGVYTFSIFIEGATSTETVEGVETTFVDDVTIIEVSFTLDADNYFVNNATISVERYSRIYEEWGYNENNDYVMLDSTENYTHTEVDGKNVYTFIEYPIYDSTYTYEIEQSTETINTHSPEDLLPTSYKLVDADGKEIDFTKGIEFEAGSFKIYFADVVPTTTILGVIGLDSEFECFVKGSTEVIDTYAIYGGYSSYDECINITSTKPGEYVVKFSILDKEYSLPVKVKYKTPTTIAIAEDTNYGSQTFETKSIYTGTDLVVKAEIESGYDPSVIAEIVGAPTGATLTPNDDGTYTFNATVAGDYTVKFTSAVAETVTAEAVITVTTPPTVEEIVQGTLKSTDDFYDVTLVFTPTTETSGTAVVTAIVRGMSGRETTYVDNFTYVIADGVFTATVDSTAENAEKTTGIKIENAVLYVYYSNAWDWIAMEAYVEEEVTTVVAGTKMDTTVLEVGKTTTYSVTIAANTDAYFLVEAAADGTAYDVGFSSNSGLPAFYMAGRNNEIPFNTVTLDYMGMSMVTFLIRNNTDAEVTVTFTLTYTAVV